MKSGQDEKFQLESCWAVTNICSGTSKHVQYIVGLGGLDYLIGLLSSNSADIADQAIWALGNIAGDNKDHKDLCIAKDIINKMVSIFNKFPDQKKLRENCIWALSNCLRGRPTCSWDQIANGVAIMKNALAANQNNNVVVADILESVSDCSELFIQGIIDLGFIPDLIYHLQNNNIQLVRSALVALGNIISGSVSQTSTVLDSKEFLPRVFQLLSQNKKMIREKACKVIADVIIRSQQNLPLILENSNYLKELIKLSKPELMEREAVRALANIALVASKEQVVQLQDQFEYLRCLLNLLESSDAKVLETVLEAISCVWKPGNEKFGSSLVDFGDHHVRRLEFLSTHENEDIARPAKNILGHLGTETGENKEGKNKE